MKLQRRNLEYYNSGGLPMNTKEYYQYKSLIETANSAKDKEALKKIKLELLKKYGSDDKDTKALIDKFKFTV